MNNLYVTVALKLFGYGIKNLHDPNWTGMYLYDQVKSHLKGYYEPSDLLLKPLERGLSYYLGTWVFDEFFATERLEDLHGEYAVWFLEDFCEMISFHRLQKQIPIQGAESLVSYIGQLYERDEEEYWEFIDCDDTMEQLQDCYARILNSAQPKLEELKVLYAEDFSDRILHDRQLCFYLSSLLHQIGFNGANDLDELPQKWVQRERWPERVKKILISRDRGVCNECGSNLVQELEEEFQIDHMIPLAKGGCNDLVNLQLLCAVCNRKKSANETYIKSSVPKYLKRKNT
ncbi:MULTISPECIES: HNH endonuclease [Shewanella]|uniref:HNH endonuclease n=3 Tax=Shewanellaceae TaxID=267890 RepID=UPI000A8FB603|nr:HNH endonuclease signature motif containing protein [Shewanella sp. ECSMB14102]